MGGWYGRSLFTSRRELIQRLGETHRRQRKGMMPAFGSTASRELVPRFVQVLDKVGTSLESFALRLHHVIRNSSMECGTTSSQTIPTGRRHWTCSNGSAEPPLMCKCPPYALPPYPTTDTQVESGKVRSTKVA